MGGSITKDGPVKVIEDKELQVLHFFCTMFLIFSFFENCCTFNIYFYPVCIIYYSQFSDNITTYC